MEKKEFYRQLRALVIPIAFQQFMLAAVSASDAVMLGMLSQDAMAAISLAGQVQFVFGLYLAAMTIGASMFAAQYWGKRDKDAVERILGMVLRFTLLVSIGFSLVTALLPRAVMGIFTSDSALIEAGGVYLRTVSPSYLLCGICQVYLCVMKSCGRAAAASRISSVGVAANIVLNALLIFGLLGFPRLEVAGAAVATVLARVIELAGACMDARGPERIHLRRRYLRAPERSCRREFWKYVAPVLGNEIVWGVGFTMSSVIMGRLGSDAVAAHSVAGIVKNLLICLCLGIGSGGGVLVGNELGAGNLERARQHGQRIARLSILSGLLAGVALLLLSPAILRFARLTPAARGYLKGMLAICACYCVGKSINSTVIGGIFCAGGDSRFGFLCDAVTLWGITVPLGLLAAFVWRLPVIGVYVIVHLDEFIKLPAVYIHFKKYKWVKDLTQPQGGKTK